MNTPTLIAPMVLACASAAAQAAPVPPAALAEAQLRALNHRFVNAFVVPDLPGMEALTADDFVLTAGDGQWHGRAAFLARMGQPAVLAGAWADDLRVRLFGPVALLHGVFHGLQADGQMGPVRYTDVYVWSGQAWRVVSAQNTPVKAGVTLAQRQGVAPPHAGWQGQDPSGDDLAVLRTLNEQYVQAFRQADVAWYDAHLAADYHVVSGDGSWQDRGAALGDFAKPTFATHLRSFPVGRVTIRRFDEVALIHAENDYEMKDGRKGISRYTDIWHRTGGRWWCVAAHITVHKAPTL
jgi:hypothetical protein